MRFDLIPDADRQILNGCHFAVHEGYIQIDVPMVKHFNNVFLYDLLEHFQVDHKPGIRIGIALNCNIQVEIMTVPVFVGAFAKNSVIFLLAPAWIIKFVSCVEMLFSGYI